MVRHPGTPRSRRRAQASKTGPPHDSAGLELRIKTPLDGLSFSYNLKFYTSEFPNYICSVFNDFFVALMTPVPMGLPDGNISFDSMGNNISVNAGFLDVCSPQMAGGKNFACPAGTAELSGTGYEGGAGTGWLVTTAPIEAPGEEITLRFAIWDSQDAQLDSIILLDNFVFEQGEAEVGTVPK